MKDCVLIGTGMGNPDNMTLEARQALENAELICGSSRIAESVKNLTDGEIFSEYEPLKIVEIFERNAEKKCAAVFSGSTGFYSGASALNELLSAKGWNVRILCGISTVQYLASRLRTDWQDWKLVSAHGRNCNIGYEIARNKKVFFLTGTDISAYTIASYLVSHGGSSVFLTVAVRLSYPDEQIIRGTAEEILRISSLIKNNLSCVLVEREDNLFDSYNGLIPDEEFIRSAPDERLVPMTKFIVRSAILSMLNIEDDDVVWDIGAGTGAVSVDMAKSAPCYVYSVEEKSAAVSLEKKNREKFAAYNMEIVEGRAPAVLESLPSPDKVFVGGSEGSLSDMISLILKRNASARIIVSAVTAETMAECINTAKKEGLDYEILQLNVSKSEKTGAFHMMKSFSPVWLIRLGN